MSACFAQPDMEVCLSSPDAGIDFMLVRQGLPCPERSTPEVEACAGCKPGRVDADLRRSMDAAAVDQENSGEILKSLRTAETG